MPVSTAISPQPLVKPEQGPVSLNPRHSLANGCQGLWLFNAFGDQAPIDNSGKNGKLTLGGTAAGLWVKTRYGSALLGNGTNRYLSAPVFPALGGGPVTLWVACITNSSGGAIAGWRGTRQCYMFHFSGGQTVEARWLGDTGGATDATFTLSGDGYHTMAVVFDGSNFTSYADGKVSTATAGAILSTSTGETLCFLQDGNSNYSNEQLLVAGVWSRALTTSEHQNLFFDPYALVRTPTMRRWAAGIAAAASIPQKPAGRRDPWVQARNWAVMR